MCEHLVSQRNNVFILFDNQLTVSLPIPPQVGMKCRCQTRRVPSELSATWPWDNWPWKQEPLTKPWHSCGNLKLVRQLQARMSRCSSSSFSFLGSPLLMWKLVTEDWNVVFLNFFFLLCSVTASSPLHRHLSSSVS